MIGPKMDRIVVDSVIENYQLTSMGLFSLDSMMYWLMGAVLIGFIFYFKKKYVRILLGIAGVSLIAWGGFISTVLTEESEKSFKQGYKEWQQKADSYIDQLKEMKIQNIEEIERLRTLTSPQPKSGMTAIKYKTEQGQEESLWVEVNVDRDLDEPYITYQELEEEFVYDKDLTRLDKGHMEFYPKKYEKGKYNVMLHTNKKP